MPDSPGPWMIEHQLSGVDGSTFLQKVLVQEGENTKRWSAWRKLLGIGVIFKDKEMLIVKSTFWGNKPQQESRHQSRNRPMTLSFG